VKRIVAILGDYYHPYEWIKSSLDQALNELSEMEQIELVEITTDQLEDELKQNPDGVILFKENRLNPTDNVVNHWMNDAVQKSISDYIESGGGLLAWHAGLASYPTEGQYVKMLRGYFEYHPVEHQVVYYTGTQESDSLNTVDFDFKDEHYFVEVDEKNTTVFLKSSSVDGTSIGGWRHSYGNGRVCCLTPAHNREGLLASNFTFVLGETIKWVMKN
jgi:type 1 glutamine amidotransferase